MAVSVSFWRFAIYSMADVTGHFQLYKSKDFTNPIAYLKNTDRNIPMLLHINAGHLELIEEILLSVLILEYKLKMYERLKKHDLLYGPLLGSLISLK
jgi:hypothetical protein